MSTGDMFDKCGKSVSDTCKGTTVPMNDAGW